MNENNILKNSIIYGLIGGLGLIILSVIMYVIDPMNTSKWVLLVNLAIMGGAIIYGTKIYRDKVNNGFISYGKALGSGVLISAIAGLVLGLYTFVFYKFIDPTMIEKLLSIQEEAVLKSNPDISDAQLEAGMNMARRFMTPLMLFLGSVISMIFWGFLMSLLSSLFLKKKDDSFDANFNQE